MKKNAVNLGVELRRAAAIGNIDKVKLFLNEKYINDTSSNGNTALHWSIEKKHYAITKLLLTISGIDVDAKNKQGATPLHFATKQGDKKTVYRLLKAGAGKKNRTDNEGFSVLDYALEKSYSFILTTLKQIHPDMTFENEDKLADQVHERFKRKNPSLIRKVQIFDPNYFFDNAVADYFQPGNQFKLVDIQAAVKKGLINPHKLFCSGNLLQSAAVSRVDTLEKFRWLLEQGVDPNLQASHESNPSSYKNTALHTLIANEDEKDALTFIDLLITHARQKFNFNLMDSEGKTCLCLAVKVGLAEVVRKLVALKDQVDVNLPDEDGNTPLHYAFLLGHVSIAAELIKNRSDTNAKNKENLTPYELLNSTDIEDVKDCLELTWINPDRKDGHSEKTYIQQCMENRMTVATYEQKRKSIAFLLAAATGDLRKIQENCDAYTLNAYNPKGNTALHLAREHGHDDIVKYLLEQPGIDLDKKAADLCSHSNLATSTRHGP